LQNQIVGGKILTFAQQRSRAGIEVLSQPFDTWKRSTRLTSRLVVRDLHPQLLEVIKPLVDELLTLDELHNVLNKAESVHSSQRPVMLQMIAKKHPSLEVADAAAFLRTFMRRPLLSEDLLEF
jgi:hypothetical protein